MLSNLHVSAHSTEPQDAVEAMNFSPNFGTPEPSNVTLANQEENFDLDAVSNSEDNRNSAPPPARSQPGTNSGPVSKHNVPDITLSTSKSNNSQFAAHDVHTFFSIHPQDCDCSQCVFCLCVFHLQI